MFRYRSQAMLAAFVLVLATVPACSSSGRGAHRMATASQPALSPALIFPPNGARLVHSAPEDRALPWPSVEAIPWEITRTEIAGRTRISAVRRRGDVTEYYNSSSGPNGSTERRRVNSRSTNAPHGRRP